MTERYTIISSDCHAGGSHAQYRDYLEAKWHDEFDEWRGGYKNAWRPPERLAHPQLGRRGP
ncbi:MAG: hypothetical protein R2695_10435 [Acidimicrobiales bacterium]